RLEHLLEDEDHAGALRRRDDGDRHGIRREGRPRSVFQLGDVPTEIESDSALLIPVDRETGPLEPWPNAKAIEAQQRRAKIVSANPFDGQLAVGDRREADEAADLDMVRPDLVATAR